VDVSKSPNLAEIRFEGKDPHPFAKLPTALLGFIIRPSFLAWDPFLAEPPSQPANMVKTNHPDAVVARILSANVITRSDLAELSLVCGRLSGDLSCLMPLLATVIQRGLRVNILHDVKDLYQDQSPSEVAKLLDEVCFWCCSLSSFGAQKRGGIGDHSGGGGLSRDGVAGRQRPSVIG
jgi:hypothetical protein